MGSGSRLRTSQTQRPRPLGTTFHSGGSWAGAGAKTHKEPEGNSVSGDTRGEENPAEPGKGGHGKLSPMSSLLCAECDPPRSTSVKVGMLSVGLELYRPEAQTPDLGVSPPQRIYTAHELHVNDAPRAQGPRHTQELF